MDRIADLDTVLDTATVAIEERDWKASERLSERVRALVLDAAMWNERADLERMRRRLLAFRSAMTRKLNPAEPEQMGVAALLRYDAGLAAVATRMRPRGHAASESQETRTATERILEFLRGRDQATTTQIHEAALLAQGTASKMLTDLRARGLVSSRRVGKHVFSRLTPRGRVAAGERPPSRRLVVDNRMGLFAPIETMDIGELGTFGLPKRKNKRARAGVKGSSDPVLSDIVAGDLPMEDVLDQRAVG